MSISNTGIFWQVLISMRIYAGTRRFQKLGNNITKWLLPKYKDGEVVVKERSIPPAYGNDVCATGNNFLICLLIFALCTGHIVNSKTFNFQE